MISNGTNLINIDLDGVLTAWVEHALKHFNIPEDLYLQPGCWNMVPALLDYLKIPTQEFWLKQVPEFWATMPWTPFGKDLLAMCENHVGIDNCRIVSTPANGYSAHGKLWWLEYNAPYYLEKRLYHLTHQKQELAAANKLLIDDADHNINAWRAHGGKAILIPTKYNSAHGEMKGNWLQRVNEDLRRFVNS